MDCAFIDSIRSQIPDITEIQAYRFERYFELLIQWNEKVNLTTITEQEEVIQKHFLDSLLPQDLIPKNAKVVDVGTGAGFPAVPLMIMRSDISVTMVDSLNKRTVFLSELMNALQLENSYEIIHARAEDIGQNPRYREKFDIALTRAVANTSTLLEWTIPLLKVGGSSLMYKASSANDELFAAKNALEKLKSSATIYSYEVEWGERAVISAKKLQPTQKQFPRKSGTAKKSPL
ncbi:MAG: 16S rRNA (guanine(527)-N(7))-methyltransferase RsmG [Clostridiales bacterium]|nr:16S rRNA (guanine(527)-N(7))-methyltransferase RsmG [Clostridiales bacterium]